MRGPLSPLVLHAQSLLCLLCFANMRLCWGRSGSDRNELMCLLQAQNWVLSFPGGDGGGGIPLAFPAAVATVYSVSGCRRAQETNQTPSYL